MPLASTSFSDIITFTRASTAWYYDSSGVLTQAAIDAPRFDYNPSTLAPQGFLVEPQRTNVVLRSAEFSNASWSKTNVTVTADSVTAPDGTLSGDTIVETTATAAHNISQVAAYTSGTTYVYSVYLKEPPTNLAKRYAVLYFTSAAFGSNLAVVVDAGTGQITSASVGLVTTITPVGNGWYRVSISATATITVSNLVLVRLTNSATSGLTSYTGDGVSGMYVWGAQLEVGGSATSYIPTTTTAVTRSADVANINTLSPWYNTEQGTVVAQIRTSASTPTVQQGIWGFDNTTANNSVYAARTITTSRLRYYAQIAGVVGVDATINLPLIANSTVTKTAVAIATNDYNAALTGTLGTQITSVSVPVVSRMTLGNIVGAEFLNGHLQQIRYYPQRLADDQLKALTA